MSFIYLIAINAIATGLVIEAFVLIVQIHCHLELMAMGDDFFCAGSYIHNPIEAHKLVFQGFEAIPSIIQYLEPGVL